MDPLGRVTAMMATTPQGQGHQTVVAQIVADELGLEPGDVTVVDEMDTFTRFVVDLVGHVLEPVRRGRHERRRPRRAQAQGQARRLRRPRHGAPGRRAAVRGRRGAAQAGKGPSYSVKDLAGRAHWNTESLPDGMEPGLQATAVFGFSRRQRRGPERLRELVEHLRVHRRDDGRGDRSRDRADQDPALCLRPRRGDDHQPDDRRGADPRGRAPRARRRAVRGDRYDETASA